MKLFNKLFSISAILMVGFAVQMPATAQTLDDLQIFTENYAPLNYEEAGKIRGIATDLMVEMLHRSGSKLKRQDIQLIPWARGYNYVQNRPNTILFAMTRTEARESLFQWVGPIIDSNIVLIGKDDDRTTMLDLNQLNRDRIVAINDDVGHQLLLEAGIAPDLIQIVSQPENAVRMLQIERVRYWAYGQIVSQWYLKRLTPAENRYRVFHILKRSQQYFAISPKTDSAIAQQLQSALEALREDGSLDRIVKTYLPQFNQPAQ